MTKVIFLLHRRAGISREESLREWSGDQHKSIASRIPGLLRVVQNHPVPSEEEPAFDGIAELWFENAETMRAAIDSTEWAGAIKEASGMQDPSHSP
ncbi:MAG: EthD family reductase [Acidobacteria bacterium]|nr:EthD family reductase [Acidobacteriota bacterium]